MCQLLHDHHIVCVPFTNNLDCLLDRLDNRNMMHSSQSDALKWVRMDQKYARYYSHDASRAINITFVLH
jgi:hypothetical protein